MHEKISALLDDELEQHECDPVFSKVSTDTNLSTRWQRYHIIRATMRNEYVHHFPHLAEKVRAAIHRDDVPVHVKNEVRENIRGIPVSPSSRGWLFSLRTIAPRLAIAASVVGAVVIGLYTFRGSESPSPTVAKFKDGSQFVVQALTKWETNSPGLQDTLNGFLVEHGEFTPASGMNGLMAYAKFVSYDVGE